MRNHLGTINGDTANHRPTTYSLLLLSRITQVDLRRRVASKKEHGRILNNLILLFRSNLQDLRKKQTGENGYATYQQL